MSQTHKGFTLVELAIALMVIGLLIGGVLKGQELIENAKITQTVRQFKEFDTAIMIFRNTYSAFPGDIKKPNRIPNCNTDNGSICGIGGNGNGSIYSSQNISNPEQELYNFFPHMTKAGMLKGPQGGTQLQLDAYAAEPDIEVRTASEAYEAFFPSMVIGYLITLADYSNNGNTFYLTTPTTKDIQSIDSKMDDGLPLTGSVITEECPYHEEDGIYVYNLAASNYYCGTWIASENFKF